MCAAPPNWNTRHSSTALYNEIWRPQGIHTLLEAVLRGARGRLLGSLVLYRAPGERRFTREDERRLGSLLPDMAAGLQAAGPALAAARLLPSLDAARTLLMTLQGEICHASPGAHRLLLMADGGASRIAFSKPLPALADGLMGRWAAGHVAGAIVAPATMAAQVRTLHGALDVHCTPDLRALLNARIG